MCDCKCNCQNGHWHISEEGEFGGDVWIPHIPATPENIAAVSERLKKTPEEIRQKLYSMIFVCIIVSAHIACLITIMTWNLWHPHH